MAGEGEMWGVGGGVGVMGGGVGGWTMPITLHCHQ